jgi:spermidine synthase
MAVTDMPLPGYRTLARTMSRDCPVALHQRGRRYAITSCNNVLMTNEDTGSERALGRLTTTFLRGVARPRILVGGLGMGFTLRAILDRLPRSGRVVVAELLRAVARWNRARLGHLSRYSIEDPRVRLRITDVATLVRQPAAWDAVVLDVDNGPEWIVQRRNLALYGREGLARLVRSLRPGGILALWSSGRHQPFEQRMRAMGLRWRRYRCVSRHGHPTGPILYIARPPARRPMRARVTREPELFT